MRVTARLFKGEKPSSCNQRCSLPGVINPQSVYSISVVQSATHNSYADDTKVPQAVNVS